MDPHNTWEGHPQELETSKVKISKQENGSQLDDVQNVLRTSYNGLSKGKDHKSWPSGDPITRER